ncbi:hypothetical protein FSP39_007417 [Pinctada imbricata]|uniref:Aminopeptidase n=1 Tax=Pinctada imbricata TaxID=66713 RepID=A0AA89BWC8_PINIB|nr:hypothetical protein FSP39_007417 [Pinctada imbricata]
MASKTKTYVNKRVLYACVFLMLALPVLVGILAWHITKNDCDAKLKNYQSSSAANTGDEMTTQSSEVTTRTPSPDEPWLNLRLSRDLLPIHYDLTLYPNFYGNNGVFEGNETVELEVKVATRFVLIHINFLNISHTSLRFKDNSQSISFKTPWFYEENQYWVIECDQTIVGGSVLLLDLSFTGSLTRAIVGFYKSTYVNSITKEESHLATSKFQPVDARRAFPCFDEPNFKANYTIHLVHRQGYVALSNMPEVTTEPWEHDSSLHITHFERSVEMSAYLVCFAVCDFTYLSDTTKYGTPIRTYATPDRVNQTAFALKVAKDSMELFEEYFNVKYPLPKQDMIAIPDFVSGAMEHWGLISYRETNMLYDENEASPANKQRVAVVVAHEIAHMWFGNMVTMDWWDDLWLNEGFASFVEYIGANHSEPSWDMLEQFVTEDVQPIMVTDAGIASHPIIVQVDNPNQINEVFDSITYSKGASIIRMLEDMMGREKFFEGIGVNGGLFNVKSVMDTWTLQMGLPYINITLESQGGQTVISATQKRFLADSTTEYDANDSPFSYQWYIYLNYLTSSSLTGSVWLNQTQTEEKDERKPNFTFEGWLLWQRQNFVASEPVIQFRNKACIGNGYMHHLCFQFNMVAMVMANVDKAGLIDDAFNLARGGYINYEVPLKLTLYLDQENAHLPWESTYTALNYISKMLGTGKSFGQWRDYILTKCKPVLERLGWEDSSDHLQNLMRANLISLTCGMADKDCLENATSRFRNWLDNDLSVSPNIRSLVYRYGMQSDGSAEDWDNLWNKYLTGTVPQEQIKLLYGMAHTRTVWLLVRFLEYTKNESLVRSQDFFTVVTYIARNPVGNSLAWDWVRTNYDYLVQRFTTYSRSFGRLVPNIISDFNTQFQLKEVEELFQKYPDAGAGRNARNMALDSIRRNIKWKQNSEDQIINWLCNTVNIC